MSFDNLEARLVAAVNQRELLLAFAHKVARPDSRANRKAAQDVIDQCKAMNAQGEPEPNAQMRDLFRRIEDYRRQHNYTAKEIELFFYNGCEDNGAADFERTIK